MNGCLIIDNKINASCIDCDQHGGFVITAGFGNISLHTLTSNEAILTCHSQSIKEKNINILRLNKCDLDEMKIAFSDISDVNISVVTESNIISIYSKMDIGGKISDIDWCNKNNNIFMTTSNDHRAYIWDLRSRNPVSWLSSLSAMKHAKFKRTNYGDDQNIIAVSESTNIKMFDMRYPKKAFKRVFAHENMINDLQWDFYDNNTIITVAEDSNLRYWDSNNLDCPINELKTPMLPANKFINSPCGKFFATTTDIYANLKYSCPSYTIWRRPFNDSIFYHDFFDEKVFDGVWQYGDKYMTELYFFFITNTKKLCRRSLNSCYLGTEIESILHAPTIQKNIDIELDERITRYDSETLCNEDATKLIKESLVSYESCTETAVSSEINSISLPKEIAIINEYCRYINVPYYEDNLLKELEALKSINTIELQAAEINFSRAAVMLVYERAKLNFKLVMEIRFHRNFINNGNILISIYEKDCPIDKSKAEEFLDRVQSECQLQKVLPKNKLFIERRYNGNSNKCKNCIEENGDTSKNSTFFCMVIKQIPKIIREMDVFPKYFTDSSDSDFSDSENEENVHNKELYDINITNAKLFKNLSKSTYIVLDKIDQKIVAATFPFNYTPNSFDTKVCLPKKFGAHFCKSGHLITFGISSSFQTIIITENAIKSEKIYESTLIRDTKFQKQINNKLHVFRISPRERNPKYRSMFRSLHHFREHLRKQFEKYILSFTSENHELTAYHLKLRKNIENVDNKDQIYLYGKENEINKKTSIKQYYPFINNNRVLYTLYESASIQDASKILLERNDSEVIIKDNIKERHVNVCLNDCVRVLDSNLSEILSHIESKMLIKNKLVIEVWNLMKNELFNYLSIHSKGFRNGIETGQTFKTSSLRFILEHFIKTSDYHSITMLSIILSRINILKPKNRSEENGYKLCNLPLSTPNQSSYLSLYGKYRASVYYDLADKYNIENLLSFYEQQQEVEVPLYEKETLKYYVNNYDTPFLFNYFVTQYCEDEATLCNDYAIMETIEIEDRIDKTEKVKSTLDDSILHHMNKMEYVYCNAIDRLGQINKYTELHKFQSTNSYLIESKKGN
uniref:WD_REPEATS_REGION domain-containing protein n=1 Tax=Parastrongyloides trichosuri TaxID=131310 RepID=A0A0N5A0F9_PARTI